MAAVRPAGTAPPLPFLPTDWQVGAICAELPEDEADAIFFPERGGSSKAAKAICARCPVRSECLDYALVSKEPFGIWGGTSERERRRLRKRKVEAA
jgi:WhiB family transcriptional regulator, redox-sensing transcriptional regulator